MLCHVCGTLFRAWASQLHPFCRLHMSSTRSSLPRTISSKRNSTMLREPAKQAGTPADKPSSTPNANLGNLQNFLRERVADLMKALEAKASTDFHDWLVSPCQHHCDHSLNDKALGCRSITTLWANEASWIGHLLMLQQ